jgi:hypothetical protein
MAHLGGLLNLPELAAYAPFAWGLLRPISHQVYDPMHLLLETERTGVDVSGIVGRLERGERTGGVGLVTSRNARGLSSKAGRIGGPPVLLQAAARPHFG